MTAESKAWRQKEYDEYVVLQRQAKQPWTSPPFCAANRSRPSRPRAAALRDKLRELLSHSDPSGPTARVRMSTSTATPSRRPGDLEITCQQPSPAAVEHSSESNPGSKSICDGVLKLRNPAHAILQIIPTRGLEIGDDRSPTCI